MFSYNEYKNIIGLIQQNTPIKDFADVTEKTKKYCVIRHDIEFSLDRAYKLAKIEQQLGISSTYTVQLRNNTYNALSDKNIVPSPTSAFVSRSLILEPESVISVATPTNTSVSL